MEAYLENTDLAEWEEEYVISCQVLVSPAESDEEGGTGGKGDLKEVVCIIDIEHKRTGERVALGLN
ncbi:MAG: hypothetical protein ACYS4W_03525 [Planctomycetota bacterium]|jgi:hypothetical protein